MIPSKGSQSSKPAIGPLSPRDSNNDVRKAPTQELLIAAAPRLDRHGIRCWSFFHQSVHCGNSRRPILLIFPIRSVSVTCVTNYPLNALDNCHLQDDHYRLFVGGPNCQISNRQKRPSALHMGIYSIMQANLLRYLPAARNWRNEWVVAVRHSRQHSLKVTGLKVPFGHTPTILFNVGIMFNSPYFADVPWSLPLPAEPLTLFGSRSTPTSLI